MTEVPPYLSMREVAIACGMSSRKVKRWLRRVHIAERMGGHWMVAESRLRERLPDLYDRVFSHLAERAQNDQKRPQTTTDDHFRPAS